MIGGVNFEGIENAEIGMTEHDAWKLARLGKITGSQFQKVKPATQTADTYLDMLVAEWLTGQPQDEVTASSLEWGIAHEQAAILEYAKATGFKVEKAGFFQLKDSQLIGCTPDGLVENGGVLEVKCPKNTTNHAKTVRSKQVPAQYIDQVLGHILITGRDWCDFVSYDPRCKKHKLVIVRVERDEKRLEALRTRLVDFENSLFQELLKLGINPATDAPRPNNN